MNYHSFLCVAKQKNLVLGTMVAVFFFLGVTSTLVLAQTAQQTINATIKLTLCGDNLIEPPEECEQLDLNRNSCDTLGYNGGSLSCDISCSYDLTNCGPLLEPSPSASPSPSATPNLLPDLSPTPRPSASASPSPSPSPSPSAEPSSSPTQTESNPTPAPSPTTLLTRLVPIIPLPVTLPSQLLIFDQNNNDELALTEYPAAAQLWVNEWQAALNQEVNDFTAGAPPQTQPKNCDLNQDSRCNLTDFSILLYYVDR